MLVSNWKRHQYTEDSNEINVFQAQKWLLFFRSNV